MRKDCYVLPFSLFVAVVTAGWRRRVSQRSPFSVPPEPTASDLDFVICPQIFFVPPYRFPSATMRSRNCVSLSLSFPCLFHAIHTRLSFWLIPYCCVISYVPTCTGVYNFSWQSYWISDMSVVLSHLLTL